MAKYIIDVPEDTTYLNALRYGDGQCVSAKSYIIPNLTPYVRSESYIDGLKKGQNEVWEFVRCIIGMDEDEYCECFDIDDITEDDFTCKYTYQEAKKIYGEWKKEEEKIHIGDEVVYHGKKYVVVYVGADEVYHLIDQTWIREVIQGKHQLTKTGHHFNEVKKLIDKMLYRSISF